MNFELTKIDWTAVGVLISALAFAGLAVSIWMNSQAIRLSAQVADVAAAFEVSERLANAGRRFENLRMTGEEELKRYEILYMSATIETYLVRTAEIREILDSDPALVVGGAARVLASALPCGKVAGEEFVNMGYPKLSELAYKLGLQTPNCPK